MRGLLVDYVRELGNLGMVFRVAFERPGPLGVQIALARYGDEGRRFVVVESVARSCVGFGVIKSTDELVAIDGKVIVEPTSEDRLAVTRRPSAAARAGLRSSSDKPPHASTTTRLCAAARPAPPCCPRK